MKQSLGQFTLTTLVAVSLIFVGWFAASSAGNQQRDRIVVRKAWPIEPVKVVGIKTKNKGDVEIGKEFDEDDDWLDGLTLTVANNYHKTVTALTIALVFRREPGDTRPPFAWNLHFGPSPRSSEYAYRDPNKVINVDKSLDLRLSPQNYQSIQSGFEQAGYPKSVKRVELVIREVGFEDGSMLYSGTLFIQDPAHPNDPTKKIKVPQPSGAQNRKIRSPPEPKVSRKGLQSTGHERQQVGLGRFPGKRAMMQAHIGVNLAGEQ